MGIGTYGVRRFCGTAFLVFATVGILAKAHRLQAATSHSKGLSLTTASRIQTPGWWPTKPDTNRDNYVGAEECGTCHTEEFNDWQTTAMAHAADHADRSDILRRHDRLSSQIGPYQYEVLTDNGKVVQEVSTSEKKSSQMLLWAFGVGGMGQTYIYEQSGKFYEGHLSFYSSIQKLDITPGQSRALPASFEEASGRLIPAQETQLCFGCHTTASSTGGKFNPDRLFPGVTCEACHGPGAKHIAAVESGDAAGIRKSVLNPRQLEQAEAIDFCGACHRTWEDVVSTGAVGLGVFNVRFAPYRLENSRCWKQGDSRLTCTSCHDPHKPLVQTAQAYDAACLQCHASKKSKITADHPGAACPVSVKECVTCHMPKYEPPGLHSKFTDHWIRVVKAEKVYPD